MITVHIGTHKAGSTSIQDFCYVDTERLNSIGVFYPKNVFSDYPEQHSAIGSVLADSQKTEELLSAIVLQAKEAGCKEVFLSGEDLCSLSASRVAVLREVCEKFFRRLRFVFIARGRRDYIMSNFKHHMRYAQPTSEIEFAQVPQFSPVQAIEIWREHFSLSAVFLHYDHIKADLLSEFFREVFCMEVDSRIRSNTSLDFLTLSICNVFLKKWASREIDLIIWDVAQKHRSPMRFAVENNVARALAAKLPESEWRPVEYRGRRSLLNNEADQAMLHDPVEVCDKMLEFFGSLREHFKKVGAEVSYDKR